MSGLRQITLRQGERAGTCRDNCNAYFHGLISKQPPPFAIGVGLRGVDTPFVSCNTKKVYLLGWQ